MKGHIEVKSAVIGAVLVLALVLLAGATGSSGRLPVVGRFQIACTNTRCYLVDTATGQVWMDDATDFKAPKLDAPASTPALAGDATDFIGQWASDDPKEDDLAIRLEPDGRAIASEDTKQYEGNWRVEGTRVIITVEDESVVGELQPDGRLLLWEEGDRDDTIMFKRVP